MFETYPDQRACVVVLANSTEYDIFGIATTLGSILFGEPYDMPKGKAVIAVRTELLRSFAGTYEIKPGVRITVEASERDLIFKSGRARRRFLPEGTGVFFREGRESDVATFAGGNGSGPKRMLLTQSGIDVEAEKVE
jgi:hypothetical protein